MLGLAPRAERAQVPALASLQHQSWSLDQGLPQSSVHSVLQSRDGFIWAATEGGVARFDGVQFRVFDHESVPSFTSNDVCCTAEDGAGGLWFGTADGLVLLQDGRWRHLGTGEGLPSASVLGLAVGGDGVLVVLTPEGVVRWTGERFAPIPGDPAQVVALGRGGDGAVLLLMRDGLARLRGAASRMLTHENLPPGRWLGVEEGPGGSLWLRSAETVLLRVGGAIHVWRTGRELPGSRVDSLRLDGEGRAWIGTNGGLAMLNLESSSAATVPALAGDSVLAVAEDREGNRWVGTDSSGLHVLRTLPFRSAASLRSFAITAVVESTDGALWVGTRENGLRRLRGQASEEPARVESLTSPVILSLTPGLHGDVWAGTPDGLNHVERDGRVRRYTEADGLPDEDVRSLVTGEDGSVWVGTRRGLAHLVDGRVDVLTCAHGLGSDLVGALLDVPSGPAAGLWVSTSGGLSLVRGHEVAKTFGVQDGLPEQIVTGLAQDGTGSLWVATEGGLVARYVNGRYEAASVFAGDNRIAGIVVAAHNDLWVRTARGLWRTALSGVASCLTRGTVCDAPRVRYGLADGLPSEEIVAGGSPVLWRGTDSELWVATRRGLASADLPHLTENRVPPPVVIEGLAVDDRPLPLGGDSLAVPYGHTRLAMEYAGLSFVAPSKVRYRVRLDGFDRGWTDAGTRRSATYTNLPPGQYVFRVQAMNNDGVWSVADARLAFRVIPPWYRRLWFVLLCVLLLGTLIYGLYRLRLRRIEREFAAVLGERNRIAREIHDTLAQDFVGVSLQLEIATQMLQAKRPDAAATQLERARQLVRDGIQDARESIWELRANTAQDSLPTRLTRLAQRYGTDTRTARAEVTGAYRALPVETESELLRIAQEALTNVEKHAGATAVEVLLEYGAGGVCLTISDNGRGFHATNVPQGHYGLHGMRERAAGLGGWLDVRSGAEGGTTVRLEAPVGAAEG